MKKLILALLLIPSLALAQSSPYVRNDTHSTVLQSVNGKTTKLGATSSGQLYTSATLEAGTALVGKVGIDQTTPGTTNAVALTAGTALVGKVGIDQTTPGTTNAVTITAATSNGYSPYTFGGLVGTVQTVKATAGTLGGYYVYSPAATACYLQIFDVATATTVTLGTTTPTISLGFPTGAAANVAASAVGIAFANGIKIAATTTRAGSTACGTGMDVNLFYK